MIELDEVDWLAAQYALGVLGPGERKLLKARLVRDPAFAGLVQSWESRLAPLSLREPGLAPPPRVLEDVLAAVAQHSVTQHAAAQQSGTIHSFQATAKSAPRAPRWRIVRPALAATLAAITIALGAVVLDRHWHPVEVMTAVLAPETGSAAADEPRPSMRINFAISFDPRTKLLTVRQSAGDIPRPERLPMLWFQPDGRADAILIGQLHRSEPMVTTLSALANHDMVQGRLLVTLESTGTESRPRGPVLASGRLHRPR